jgi:hypothetical protein
MNTHVAALQQSTPKTNKCQNTSQRDEIKVVQVDKSSNNHNFMQNHKSEEKIKEVQVAKSKSENKKLALCKVNLHSPLPVDISAEY